MNSTEDIYMPARSYWSGTIGKYQYRTLKVARKAFNIGEVWNQYVAMVTNMLGSYCGAPVVESYCQESNVTDST